MFNRESKIMSFRNPGLCLRASGYPESIFPDSHLRGNDKHTFLKFRLLLKNGGPNAC